MAYHYLRSTRWAEIDGCKLAFTVQVKADRQQIGQVPGITTRWALASDSQDIPILIPNQVRRRSRASPAQRQRTISQTSRSPTEHVPQSVADVNEPAPISPLSARSLPSEYAGLTKTLAPTYKGRLLKEERSDGGSRFVDECAIFVGRLVKGVETEFTLLDRFAKYGRIVCHLPEPSRIPLIYSVRSNITR